MPRPRHTLQEQYYKAQKLQKEYLIKTIICVVATVAAIATVLLPTDMRLKAEITTALAVAVCAVCYKELYEGIISVFGGLPTNDTLRAAIDCARKELE